MPPSVGETAKSPTPIRVLFLCTGNSARSQIAQAVLEQIGGVEFDVESAGTQPRGVNPLTVAVLADAGIDWSRATSKSAQAFLGTPFDYVITVCDRARQACPVFPGPHESLHWDLEDPAEVEGSPEDRLAAFRRTYADLRERVGRFATEARSAAVAR